MKAALFHHVMGKDVVDLPFWKKSLWSKETVRQFQEPGTLSLSDAPGDEAHRGFESPEWKNERSNPVGVIFVLRNQEYFLAGFVRFE